MQVYVYLVEHKFADGHTDLCGIFCTKAQAVHQCEHHGRESADMVAVSWRRIPLWGFPYFATAFGFITLVGALITRWL